MAKLLIIKTGSAYPDTVKIHGDFEQMFIQGLGLNQAQVEIHTAFDGTPLPDPDLYCGIVITGAQNMVTDTDSWIRSLSQWIKQAAVLETPILGVCFGHQLLGHALGGRVGPNPTGPEIGTVEIGITPEAANDPLFQDLPEQFLAHVTHQQSILDLPDDTVVLAVNGHDANQAIRIGDRIWGVQFHPEFTAPVTRDYINGQSDILTRHNQNPSSLLEQVCGTPCSNRLLRSFAAICKPD